MNMKIITTPMAALAYIAVVLTIGGTQRLLWTKRKER